MKKTFDRTSPVINGFSVGQVFTLGLAIDEALVAKFAQFSGDTNPIHLQSGEAKAYGYARPIAHGAILVSLISRAIGMEVPGPGAVWISQFIEWPSPVFVGDDVELTVRIMSISTGANILCLETTAMNQKGTLVMTGKATVKVSEKIGSVPVENGKTAQVALVMGGSRGIGAAIARVLAAQGYSVALTYMESKVQAQAVVNDIRRVGGRADLFNVNLSNPVQAADLVKLIQKKWGSLDLVVHGASPSVQVKKVSELQYADVEPFFQMYIASSLALVEAALPVMVEKKYGRFIFIGTSALFNAPPAGLGAYVIAKEALWGLVKCLATELGPQGITTNLVSPSLTITDFTDYVSVRVKEIEARKSPMRRLATIEDTAHCVAFLASPAASFINGVNMPVIGGPV